MLDSFGGGGEFTFLKFLSILAFLTTVGLFFCGIPICRQIWKRKDTTEISGAPFLMGVLGGLCWLTYGYLKGDETVKYVTGAQVFLYSVYTVFYFFMTKKKFWISVKIVALLTTCTALVLSVYFFDQKVFHPLGIVCMTLNVGDFAAPLAGLRVVIRRRATSTLPLPLCIANFMVSSEWFLYGLLVKDFYLITPNGIGSFLAFIQLVLFFVLPRKPNQRAPCLRLYDFVRRCGSKDRVTDIESAAVVPVEKNDETRISKHRWSSRMITNVAGEIENVIQKVHLGDQFGYSMKVDKEDESSTDSVQLTPERNGSRTPDGESTSHVAADDPTNQPKIVFPMTIKDERQLFHLSQRILSRKQRRRVRNGDEDAFDEADELDRFAKSAYAAPQSHHHQKFFTASAATGRAAAAVAANNAASAASGAASLRRVLKRCQSAPDLAE